MVYWATVLLFSCATVLLAGRASAAEIAFNEQAIQTGITPHDGFITQATTCCQDTGADGTCDSGSGNCTTAPATGHWTKPYNCRGKQHGFAELGQGAAVAGNTNVQVFNCRPGYDKTLGPQHANNARYCQDFTARFGSGLLTDTARDMFPDPHAGYADLVGYFTCTTNCEASQLTFGCF